MPSTDEFVTTQEAARQLGVSVRSVQLWVESGVLHAWKTAGGHRRIARASVEDLLAQQREVIETVTGLKVVKLLVIEEQPAYLELYRLKIESFDLPVSVLTAADGFDGLFTAGRYEPQIVVVSLDLERLDGFALLRTLSARLPATELIALTSRDDDAIAAAGGLPERATVFRQLTDLDGLNDVLERSIEAVRAPGR